MTLVYAINGVTLSEACHFFAAAQSYDMAKVKRNATVKLPFFNTPIPQRPRIPQIDTN